MAELTGMQAARCVAACSMAHLVQRGGLGIQLAAALLQELADGLALRGQMGCCARVGLHAAATVCSWAACTPALSCC